MDAQLKTLIDGYGRACRRDGNPAWESEEGIALLAYVNSPDATPVATVHAGGGEISLSTTAAQRTRLAVMHGAPLYAGRAAAAPAEGDARDPAPTAVQAESGGQATPDTLPEAASANELHFLRRARDGWQDEAQSLQRRLAGVEADNALLRKKVTNDVWTFQGDDEDYLESMGADMVVVIRAADLRTLLANERERAASVVPPEVIAWRDAYQALLDASVAYNAHLAYVTKHLPLGADVSVYEEALNAAQRSALAAVKPMHDALSTAVAASQAAAPAAVVSDRSASDVREPVAS